MTVLHDGVIDPAGALWLAAEDAAERAERESGWYWAWGETPCDERPRQFVWRLVLDAPLAAAS